MRYARAHFGDPGTDPVIFISSAYKDEKWLDRISSIFDDKLRHLLCAQSGKRYVCDHFAHPQTGTRAGTLIPEEIAARMWNCRGALLILSLNFFDSPWCRDVEAPCLVWRRQTQDMPLFVVRLGPTNRESNIVMVEDESGLKTTLDLNEIVSDSNPHHNRSVRGRKEAFLPDMRRNNQNARLIAIADDIYTQVKKRWHGTARFNTIVPSIASPPLVAHSEPMVVWEGDFSSAAHTAVRGRGADTKNLSDQARDPDRAVIAVTALGGQGKTALVRAWIDSDVRESRTRAFDNVFAFSFYHGHTQDEFAKKLAMFLNPSTSSPKFGDLVPVQLVEMLRDRRMLLFLDGLEEIQSKEGNENVGRVAQGPVLDLLFGLCEREALGSLAVITSRLKLAGFEDYDGTGVIVSTELGGLTDEAGGKLLLDLGVVNTSDAKREQYSRDLAGHPLMLRVFADAVRRRALEIGFGNAAEKIAEAMNLSAPIEVKDKLAHVVGWYRDQFGAQERAIIEAVAVFGGTATIERIRAYLRQRIGRGSGAQDAAVAEKIETLVTSGILQFDDDGSGPRYSCHPILREAFRPDEEGTYSAATISIYSRPSPLKPVTLAEAEPYLEAIRIHADAGSFKEASKLLGRHLDFGDVLENFVGGQRALLECLLGFVSPDRREACESELGRKWLVAMVPRVVTAGIALDEWEIAEEYARLDAGLTANDPNVAKAYNISLQARIACEIGAADAARNLYESAIEVKIEKGEEHGGLILERAELERNLGALHEASRLIGGWLELKQSAEEWIFGWGNVIETVGRIIGRSHPEVALRYLKAREFLLKVIYPVDRGYDEYFEYELLNLKPRAKRTRQDWERLLNLAESLERSAEAFRSKSLGSWPIARAMALNGLGRAQEAEDLAWRSIRQLHIASWRRLWLKLEIARARLMQGNIQAGLGDAWEIFNSAQRRQRYLMAYDAAELILEFSSPGDDRIRPIQRLIDLYKLRFREAGDEIPDLGPLPGEAGWDWRVTELLLEQVGPQQRDTPATQAELDNALVLAAGLGLSGAVLELVRLGASVRGVSEEKTSALAVAVRRGHQRVVETLLAARSEPFDLEDENDRRAALAAIGASEDGLLKRLLDACVTTNANLLGNLLALAAGQSSGRAIRDLCDAGANASQLVGGVHPFVRAAQTGNLSALEELAGRVGDINKASNGGGETALMAAVRSGQAPVIVWLLSHGANLDVRDGSGRSAISYAVQRGQVRILELLAAITGRDVFSDIDLMALAVNASSLGLLDELRRAMSHGARINTVDQQGRTPIMAAAARGHLDLIRAMTELSPDLDVNISDRAGRTALMAAAEAGQHDIVTALVKEFGARCDLTDGQGRDAITYALAGNQPDTIRILGSLGARPSDSEASINAIRTAATEANRDALVAFLEEVAKAGWLDHLAERIAP
jgi:ankyrin repeat protein